MKTITTMSLCALLMITAPGVAQWARHPDPRVPRLPDGKPDLSAPTPRTSDGQPDLSGVWVAERELIKGLTAVEGPDASFNRYFIDITVDLKPEEVQIEPWAEALLKQNIQGQGKDDPIARCKPVGVPALGTFPTPHKIVQTRRLILILYELDGVFRQIFLDGHKPIPDANPSWMGYSTGKWEGDTLVVDTVGFNDQSWLDRTGHPHSEALHVIERFRRRDIGHLEVEVTIDDPKTYRKPIVYTQRETLLPDGDLLEYFCTENEKDVPHYR